MKRVLVALSLSLSLLAGTAWAEAPAADSCEAKAVGKDGKPLAGAAKASFIKKCEKELKAAAGSAAKTECEAKAVGKDGKPLAGAAKNAFVKKCIKDAGKPAK